MAIKSEISKQEELLKVRIYFNYFSFLKPNVIKMLYCYSFIYMCYFCICLNVTCILLYSNTFYLFSKEYTMYKDFLEKLTPQDWKEANLKPKSLKIKVKQEKNKTKNPQVSDNFFCTVLF